MRKAGLILALLVLLAVALRPGEKHLPLDPDEPIAADGSSVAGNARTIFDVEPLLGAFGEPKPPDHDDTKEMQTRAEIEAHWTEAARDAIGPWLYRSDWRLCEGDARVDLIAPVRPRCETAARAEGRLAL